jgi:hypothetical protein
MKTLVAEEVLLFTGVTIKTFCYENIEQIIIQ